MKLLLLLSFSISLWFCVSNAIRGGYDADPGEYPYFVRIGLRFLDDYGRLENTFCCGGSLISKNSVLTAAHCLDQIVGPKKESFLHIEIEDHLHGRHVSCGHRIHPEWGNTHTNDIALVKLCRPIENIQPIVLPNEHNQLQIYQDLLGSNHGFSLKLQGLQLGFDSLLQKGFDATAIGIGATSGHNGKLNVPNKLQAVSLKLILKDPGGTILDTYVANNKGIHAGDSGSPLIIRDKDSKLIQVGIASASDTLTNANIFVSLFDDRLQWIQGGLQDFEKSSQYGFWPSDLNISFIQPLGHLAWNTFEWSSSNHWWLMIVILAMIAGLATYIYQNHYLSNYEIKDLNGVRMRKMIEFRNRQQQAYDNAAKILNENKKTKVGLTSCAWKNKLGPTLNLVQKQKKIEETPLDKSKWN